MCGMIFMRLFWCNGLCVKFSNFNEKFEILYYTTVPFEVN